MFISELLDNIKPRVQRLGLVDPQTGFYDEDEVLYYIVNAERYLANRYQLQHFLNINRELFRTTANVETYDIPPNYGFFAPEETRRSGFAVTSTDGTGTTNLYYYDPARYNLLRTSGAGKPQWFTLMADLIYLQPVPDAVYVIEAIMRPTRDSESDIPEAYGMAVAIETLWRMASDAGKATPVLQDERTETLRTLVNNEHRQRQRFYTSPERVGFRHRYGRSRF